MLVVATGFYTTELPIAAARRRQARPVARRPVARLRHGGVQGHDHPELPQPVLHVVGPNVGLGHSSMVLMIESQVAYIRDALKTMRKGGYDVVEVDQADDRPLQRRAAGADEADRVERRRLRQLVPRLARQEHHAVAVLDARLPSPPGVVRRRRLHPDPRRSAPRARPRRTSPHEDAERQGRRDHRRGLRHRPRARGQPGPSRLAARAVRRQRDRSRRDRRPGREGRRPRGAQRPPRRGRPGRDGALRPRRRAALRPGQRRRQQRRRLADRRLHRPRVRRHRLDRRRELLGRPPRHQGVPAAPDRLR